MLRGNCEDNENILETIQLTSKLEQSLRKLMTSRKYSHLDKTQEKVSDHVKISALEQEVKQLRQENKELFVDNQQVCRDVMRLKDENRELKKQLAENKKYIEHLQGYNGDLKKQLLFWMRKPKGSQNHEKEEQSVGELMTEVLKLRRENEVRQNELQSLRKTMQVTQIKLPQSVKRKNLTIDSLSRLKKKQQQIVVKPTHKHNKSTNECTSCNYTDHYQSKNKKIFLKKSLSTAQKQKISKNLCECHKKYVETSRFFP